MKMFDLDLYSYTNNRSQSIYISPFVYLRSNLIMRRWNQHNCWRIHWIRTQWISNRAIFGSTATVDNFLSHLSPRLITICPLSVVIVLVVVVVVVVVNTFSSSSPEHLNQFLPNLTQTSLSDDDSDWFKWRAPLFFKGR